MPSRGRGCCHEVVTATGIRRPRIQPPALVVKFVRKVLDTVCDLWLDNDMTTTNAPTDRIAAFAEAFGETFSTLVNNMIQRGRDAGLDDDHIAEAIKANMVTRLKAEG